MSGFDLQDFVARHPFGMGPVPRASKEQRERSAVHNFIPQSLERILSERLFIEAAIADGYTAEELVPILRAYDRRMMEPVLVDIGEEESEGEEAVITEQTTDVEETITIEVVVDDTEAAKKLARAMKVFSDVAKIYKKYGNSAQWHPIEPAHSEPKRATRLAEATVPTGRYACGRCGLLFVALTNQRCQCKVAMKRKHYS